MERDPLLVEREKTHGSFSDNARISQTFKSIIHQEARLGGISNIQWEVLDMIAIKLSRILSGHASYRDHWDDIAGYAKLAAEACDEPK